MKKHICPNDPTSGISMDELKQGIAIWERSLKVKVSEREKINAEITKLESEIQLLKDDNATPKTDYGKYFEKMKNTKWFREVYENKSVGDIIQIES
jgi:hypothetical protein